MKVKITLLAGVAAVALAACTSATPPPTVVTVTPAPPPAVTVTPEPEPTVEETSAYERGFNYGYRRTTKFITNRNWCAASAGVSKLMIETLARQEITGYSGQTKKGIVDGVVQATMDGCR